MKTEETNKLIAKFMGYKNIANDEDKQDYLNDVMQYNSDWNYLMEVVQKITTLEEFQEWEFNSLFWEVFCQLDITEIYNQVVLFIEYYNEN